MSDQSPVLAGVEQFDPLAELSFSPLKSYIDGLIVEGFGIIDGKSAAFQHRSRVRELSVDMRSGTMGMDEMRDAFGEVTWHQAQARRWRSENDS